MLYCDLPELFYCIQLSFEFYYLTIKKYILYVQINLNIYIYCTYRYIYNIYSINFRIFGGSVRLNSFKCFSFVAILDTEIIFEFQFLLYDCEDISACDKKDK